jgi:hypothetical protein
MKQMGTGAGINLEGWGGVGHEEVYRLPYEAKV